MINGYRPSVSKKYVEQVFHPLAPINNGELDRGLWQWLRDWEVRFLLVHEEAFPSKVSPFPPRFTVNRLRENGYLEYSGSEGMVSLFKVREEPVPGRPAAGVHQPGVPAIKRPGNKKTSGRRSA